MQEPCVLSQLSTVEPADEMHVDHALFPCLAHIFFGHLGVIEPHIEHRKWSAWGRRDDPVRIVLFHKPHGQFAVRCLSEVPGATIGAVAAKIQDPETLHIEASVFLCSVGQSTPAIDFPKCT